MIFFCHEQRDSSDTRLSKRRSFAMHSMKSSNWRIQTLTVSKKYTIYKGKKMCFGFHLSGYVSAFKM